MNKKMTALISAVAVSVSMLPATMVNAVGTSLNDVLKEWAEVWLAEGSNDSYVWSSGNRIENKAAIAVNADMKAKKNDRADWRDKVSDNTYSASRELSKTMVFNYKTELRMSSIMDEYTKVTGLAGGVISAECAADTDGGARKAALQKQLEESYISGAEFEITVENPNGMTIANADITGGNMYGFTAVNKDDSNDVISPDADGKLVITGDETDTENGKLVYVEKSRTASANGDKLVITVATEGKTSSKALSKALNYNLVLECDNITAKGPSSYNSSKTYKLIGTVTGFTPIYVDNPAAEIAYITYEAKQDKTNGTEYDDANEISAEVKITTMGSGGGGGGYPIPVTPTPTPIPTPIPSTGPTPTVTPTLTPTYAPTDIIKTPEIFNSADHYAYIIGYPEGDVRPENNISREEVATIFFRLLTDESRAKMFAKMNKLTDVDSDRWSNNAISTLENGGYINGYEDSSFKPGEAITRAEFVTLATKFYDDVVASDANFRDVTNHWAKQYINQAVFYRLIDGYSDGTFKPDDKIKRCEVMKIVNTILNRSVTAENLLPEAVEKNWSDNAADAWYYTDVFEATMTHDFEREEGKLDEKWTALKENPDWVNLEKEWVATGTEENN